MNWNDAEQWAKPDPVAKALGDSFMEALQGALGASGTNDRQPEASEHQPERLWQESDFWHGVPAEFHGAALSEGLKTVLRQRPVPLSFALVGPPGTGKTRSLWAIFHAMRRREMMDALGSPIQRGRVSQGEYSSRRQTYDEAIAEAFAQVDGLEFISEVGDIRAKRYDRAALDKWASTDKWLAVDDIGAIEPNEWVREALYHLANERRSQGRVTVWTSNLTVQQLRETFGGAIASRILGGAVIETGGEDRRTS